ncbi:MAG TPA: hypothetical protein VGB61_05650, partial [Pyrinomonadaceae bacterium]
IMDEVAYNDRGNRLTMVKRPEESFDNKLIDSLTPEEHRSRRRRSGPGDGDTTTRRRTNSG